MVESNLERTHFQVNQHGHILSMVQSNHGMYSITRNGRPIAGCRWSALQLVSAIRCFRALVAAKGLTLPVRKRRRIAGRLALPRTYRLAIETWDGEGGASAPDRRRTRWRRAGRGCQDAERHPLRLDGEPIIV